MKVGLDENIGVSLARALHAFGPRCDLVFLPELYGHGASDVALAERFAADGGDCAVSGDRHILARPHELVAYMDSGLVLIALPPAWNEKRAFYKAGFLIRWWQAILDQAA